MEDNLCNNSFTLEIPVQQVPTALADKEPIQPLADDAMETDPLDESPQASMARLKTKLAALVAVRLAEGPSESLDRGINTLQEEITQSTRSRELLDDAPASRHNTPTVIAQVPASGQKDQKIISAVHKLYPKIELEPSDPNNIEEYLERFERIFQDNNLTPEQT
ncbi:hypothetical protein ROZALSC1DRAFT_25650 [Rozella allomycis CSF55]|uniref:Uncharacterized protein n=1 Tax=Rozella allomycis (strain CSF55) TaxID=988480 RepID=A0A4P9YBZ7_ROZAC|nr:hypothetical protein ROZALSC1DRAFT_25650 [Rozella allomycis CSF55]